MNNRRIDGFFYGLFMDSEILNRSQIVAANPRRAYIEGFTLRIGQRATLEPCLGARIYGMAFELTHDELDELYTAPGLEEYRPEAVLVHSLEGETFPALCYNLREIPEPHETNADYARRLRETLGQLGFPAGYIASIR